MPKYMYLIRGGDAQQASLSPEAMQKHMEVWKAWLQDLAEKKIYEDGLPLSQEGKQVKKSGEIVTDGPYIEGKEIVGGYIIVNAKDMDEAIEISKGCPVFEHDGEVEIREIMSMDM